MNIQLRTSFQERLPELAVLSTGRDLADNRPPEAADEVDLADLWTALISGRLFVHEARHVNGRCFVIFEKSHGASLGAQSRQILQRALCGERLKVLSIELGLSAASVSQRCSSALATFGYESRLWKVPVLLVAAAHAAQGITVSSSVSLPLSPGGRFVVSCAMPGSSWRLRLSRSEYDVAKLMIEGNSHEEIASVRQTAKRTIANQVSAIFRKLSLSGRSELRARAILDDSHDHISPRLLRVPVRQIPWHQTGPGDCGHDAR